MNYYKIVFESGEEDYEWITSSVSYLSDCENLLLSIQMHNSSPDLELITKADRLDQINSAGEVNQTQIFPNKQLEESLLKKKQQNWN